MLAQDFQATKAFYAILGFEPTYEDGGFMIVTREGVSLHFNGAEETWFQRAFRRRHCGVCWIGVKEGIEALYESCRAKGIVVGHLALKDYGFKEFVVRDPYGNLVLLAQPDPKS